MTGFDNDGQVDSNGPLLVEAAHQFMEDRALRLGAGLAYYGLITLAPLLILLQGIAGLIVGDGAANVQLTGNIHIDFRNGLLSRSSCLQALPRVRNAVAVGRRRGRDSLGVSVICVGIVG